MAATVGIRRVRSIKILPRDQWSLQDLQEMVRWPIWAQQPQAPPADMPRPLGMPGSFGGTKRSVNPQTARRFLKRFKEAKGVTPRCAGCDPENRRQHKHHDHNKQCKRRQSEFREEMQQQEQTRVETQIPVQASSTEESQRLPTTSTSSSRPTHRLMEKTSLKRLREDDDNEGERLRGDIPGTRKADDAIQPSEEPPMKCRSDDVMVEMLEESLQERIDTVELLEEAFRKQVLRPQDDFGTYLMQLYQPDDEPEIFVGTAPGFDESWKELPYAEVLAGRKRELQCLVDFGTYEEVEEKDLPTGTKIVSCRFLYRKRPKDVKARVVVQQMRRMATGYSWVDLFAAAPTAPSHALMIWHALRKGWPIWEGDLTTAFLHAELEPDEQIYVRPPVEVQQGKVWKLKKALYGMRISPRVFQRWLQKQFQKIDFKGTRACPMTFWRQKDESMMLAHADNIRLTAEPSIGYDIMMQLSNMMKVNWEEPLGTEWQNFLGSSWRRPNLDEIHVRPSQEHIDKLLQVTGLVDAKPLSSPAWSPQEEKMAEVDLADKDVSMCACS